MRLSCAQVFTLRRHALDATLAEHPVAAHSVYTAKRRITLQRSVLKYLVQQQGKAGPASFIMGSLSSGAEKVRERLTLEQKVDATSSKLEDVSRLLLARARADAGEQLKGALGELDVGAVLGGAGASVSQTSSVGSGASVDTVGVSAAVSTAVAASVKETVRAEVRKELGGVKQEMAELKALLASLAAQPRGDNSPSATALFRNPMANQGRAEVGARTPWPRVSWGGGERKEHACAQV